MKWVSCCVSLVLLGLAVGPLNGQECSSLPTCFSCVTVNTSCAWCNSPELFDQLVMEGQSLTPAQLCGTPEELAALNCTAESIIYPTTNISVTEAENDSAVSVEKIRANIRIGEPAEVLVNVQPPGFVDIDMYVLVDLTMRSDVFDQNQASRQDLVELMRSLSSKFRVAYGTYVDKPISPFVNPVNPSLCSGCQEPHSFQHRLNFTDDAKQFEYLFGNQTQSASQSDRRSMLDAILQIAACENEFGWSPQGLSRRIILALTHSDYHCALDGRIAGLVQPSDNECQMDFSTGLYDAATERDYPTLESVRRLLDERQISTIIAYDASLEGIYERLSEAWRTALSIQQTPQSVLLISGVEDRYQELSTTIVPSDVGLDNVPEIAMSILPREGCSNGTLRPGSADICTDILYPDSVNYTVSISVDPSFCDREDSSSTFLAQLLFIGYGVVDIEISVHCSCDCAPPEPSSMECNGAGTYDCSTCICDEGYIGSRCNCSENTGVFLGCVPSGGGSICSGNGECICDECHCNVAVEATQHLYQGSHCQCDPNLCPRGFNTDTGALVPCSGHGTCGCNITCACDPGFSGPSCECSNDTTTCAPPQEDSESEVELCSGSGNCLCGVCICEDYSIRAGTYCEQCGVCAMSCNLLRDCVSCVVSGTCDSLQLDCSNIKTVDNVAMIPNYKNIVFRNCSVRIGDCEIVYSIDQYVMGTESTDIYVYIDNSQTSYLQYMDDPSNGCSQSLLIWPIPVGIILGIIIVVIIAFALWKGISYLGEYVEYKTWEKSLETDPWSESNPNPMFIDPTAKYENPKYRRPVNVD